MKAILMEIAELLGEPETRLQALPDIVRFLLIAAGPIEDYIEAPNRE